MKFKNNILRLILTGFLFCIVLQSVNSQESECPVDICIKEIRELNAEEVFVYFETKDGKAVDAWRVMYDADPNANRLNIRNLEEVEDYLSTTGLQVQDVVEEIKESSLGFEGWLLQKLTPPKSTEARSINQLLDDIEYSTSKKKDLEQDLKSSDKLANALGTDPDLLHAWSLFYDIKVSETLRKEVNSLRAMASHVKKINKEGYSSINVEYFNLFVKDKLDKTAYVRSILYPRELYGGIKVSNELLGEVPIVTAKVSSPQFSGSAKFGAYEIRIQNDKVQYLVVDSKGNQTWEAFNHEYDLDFVITNDGTLRIGYGHYNLSGEARTIISAGKLLFKNGEVLEIANRSGHYLPSNENGSKVAEVFRKLKIVSPDFQVIKNPLAKAKESD